MNLAFKYPIVYWNCACLIVDSGSVGSGTDYNKIAIAIGKMRKANIKVSLPDINQSDFGFKPDEKNNRILCGLKSLANVGDEVVIKTIDNRPYVSPKDYLDKVHPNKQAMISLIKGGAFDSLMDRKLCMAWYIWETCNKKSKINLQNMSGLIRYNLLPEETEEQVMARRVYEFNRYLKSSFKQGDKYILTNRAISFLNELGIEPSFDSGLYLPIKKWEKVYQKWMDVFREWMAANHDKILQKVNDNVFREDWEKYALGNYSSWEMQSLCFYYHEHELAHVNNNLYGFADFSKLPEEPEIVKTFGSGGKIFQLHTICGTCIAKDKNKSTVSLLTTTGVVNIKFRKEYFSIFDKRISEIGADGTKHCIEESWFSRGSMIAVQGIRSGDNFVPKKYKSSNSHELYKIDKVYPDGRLALRHDRYKGEESESND
jgi:DNA polymerase-3 subunit alpha